MQTNKKPKRLTDSLASPQEEAPKKFEIPKDEPFDLPNLQLNLAFFLHKGKEPFTVQTLIEHALGSDGFKLTQSEQIYVILNAMKDLDLVAPLEFECAHCDAKNPVALNLPRVMKSTGQAKSHFFIEHLAKNGNKIILEFQRPEKIREVEGISSNIASLGVFMLQWLVAHNQGENFDITKLDLATFVEILNKFGEKMFGVEFKMKTRCAICKQNFSQDFQVTLEDLVQVLNEM